MTSITAINTPEMAVLQENAEIVAIRADAEDTAFQEAVEMTVISVDTGNLVVRDT